MIRMAFLFRVVDKEDNNKWFVKIAKCIDYVTADVEWMDDERLPQYKEVWVGTDSKVLKGEGTLTPSIDITAECHEFKSEDEALKFIAEHYERELNTLRGHSEIS